MDRDELTDEELREYREQALSDTAQGEEMVNTFCRGLRQFEFFNPGAAKEDRVATLIQIMYEVAGEGGSFLLAAVAILRLADEDESPLVPIEP